MVQQSAECVCMKCNKYNTTVPFYYTLSLPAPESTNHFSHPPSCKSKPQKPKPQPILPSNHQRSNSMLSLPLRQLMQFLHNMQAHRVRIRQMLIFPRLAQILHRTNEQTVSASLSLKIKSFHHHHQRGLARVVTKLTYLPFLPSFVRNSRREHRIRTPYAVGIVEPDSRAEGIFCS